MKKTGVFTRHALCIQVITVKVEVPVKREGEKKGQWLLPSVKLFESLAAFCVITYTHPVLKYSAPFFILIVQLSSIQSRSLWPPKR